MNLPPISALPALPTLALSLPPLPSRPRLTPLPNPGPLLTVEALCAEARRVGRHPAMQAFTMVENSNWWFTYKFWLDDRWQETRARLGITSSKPLGQEYGGELLLTCVQYVNNSVPKVCEK